MACIGVLVGEARNSGIRHCLLLQASTLYAIRAALVEYSRLDRRRWPIASRRKIMARMDLLSALPRAELERAPVSKLALSDSEIERLAKAGIVAVAQVALLPKGAYSESLPYLADALTACLLELALEVKTAGRDRESLG